MCSEIGGSFSRGVFIHFVRHVDGGVIGVDGYVRLRCGVVLVCSSCNRAAKSNIGMMYK